MDISEKIKYIRTKNSLSQKELSERIYVTRQAITNYERGANNPSVDVLMELSREFDIPVEWFLNDDFGLEYFEKPEEAPAPLTPKPKKERRKLKRKGKIVLISISSALALILCFFLLMLIPLLKSKASSNWSTIGYYVSYSGEEITDLKNISTYDIPYHMVKGGKEYGAYYNENGVSVYAYSEDLRIYSIEYNPSIKKYSSASLGMIVESEVDDHQAYFTVNEDMIYIEKPVTEVTVCVVDVYNSPVDTYVYELKDDGIYLNGSFLETMENHNYFLLPTEYGIKACIVKRIQPEGTDEWYETYRESEILFLSDGDYHNKNAYQMKILGGK